jgi:hypothetical protein
MWWKRYPENSLAYYSACEKSVDQLISRVFFYPICKLTVNNLKRYILCPPLAFELLLIWISGENRTGNEKP